MSLRHALLKSISAGFAFFVPTIANAISVVTPEQIFCAADSFFMVELIDGDDHFIVRIQERVPSRKDTSGRSAALRQGDVIELFATYFSPEVLLGSRFVEQSRGDDDVRSSLGRSQFLIGISDKQGRKPDAYYGSMYDPSLRRWAERTLSESPYCSVKQSR